MAKLLDIVKPGVVTGEDVQKIFAYAKANNFAIPAVNCVGSDSVNTVLETAARVKAPVIIQFSNGGAAFYAGKGIKPTSGARPDVLGAIAGAKHVHTLAKEYGVQLFFIPTTRRKNYFHGSMAYLKRVKNTLQKLAVHYSLLTCLTYLKSRWKKTWQSAVNTLLVWTN